MSRGSMSRGLSVSQAIANLRQELAQAQRDARMEAEKAKEAGLPRPPTFIVGPVQIDLALELAGGVESGVHFWVVQIGAKGSVSSTHRLTVSLTPHDAGGSDLVVASSTSGRPAGLAVPPATSSSPAAARPHGLPTDD